MTKQTNVVSGKVVNSFVDKGDGVVYFPNGLTITDDSVMWSGTKYDIESLNIDEYPGQLTLDHFDSIGGDYLIGHVEGVKKKGNKVTIDSIRYAIDASENAMRAYKLLIGGFSNAFSIESIGPWADEETGTMYNHKLVGLSQVVMGNNKHAVANSINPATKLEKGEEVEDADNCVFVNKVEVKIDNEAEPEKGESVAKEVQEPKAEEEIIETPAEEVEPTTEAETVENEAEAPTEEPAEKSEGEAEEVEVENEAESEEETEAGDDKEVVEESEEKAEEPKVENDVEADAEAETTDDEPAKSETEAETEQSEEAEPEVPAENEVSEPEEAVADDTDEATEDEPAEEEAQEETKTNNSLGNEMTKEEIQKMINEAVSTLAEAQAPVEEPEKVETETEEVEADNGYSLEKHFNLAVKALKTKSSRAFAELEKVNEKNLNALKAAGKVNNSMTIEDWGNFVLPPEMWNEIVGLRTDYSAILDATNWRETDRLEFAWLTRDGDIEMSNTAMCEARPATSPDTSNLKPISTYGATQHVEQMEHLAAITPVCTAATKYLAVDLIQDAILGYRNNYDKKRAELVIAKLQEAVNISGNKVPFNSAASDENKLKTFINTIAEISDSTSTGTFVFTQKTLLKIMEYVTPRESALGDRVFDAGTDGIRRIFGTPYVVVPNSLMPSLDSTAANPVFSYIPVDASSTAPEDIEITSTVFYGDLSLFQGYTSGGLQFDMDERVAYELPNGTVRSAYQRDEIVLRGYFFRGAAYRMPEAMAAITNEAISS